jgi:MFS family permease
MLNVPETTPRPARGIFYGWWIVGAGFALQAINGGLLFHGFTVYFLPLQDQFGWSGALIAGAFSLSRFESAILGPIQGWAVDKYGPRFIMVGGIVLFGIGFFIFSAVNSIFTFFLAFAFLSVGSSLGGFLSISATIAQWFARKRSLAMGISMTGMGLGGVMVPAIAWSVTNQGWQTTAFISGILVWVIGIPSALIMRHKPEVYGYLPDGDLPAAVEDGAADGSGAVDVSDGSFSAREALRTPAFWLLSGGHAAALLVVSTVSIHQVPHMVNNVGLSLEAAGGMVALLLAITVVGQLGGGYVADRVNKQFLLVVCMLGHAGGMLFLAYATSVPYLLMFAVLHGLAWGVRGPTIQAIRADYFGRASFGTIMGFSSMVIMVAMIAAPIFAGWMADLRGGDYQLPFTIMSGLVGLGALFFVFSRKPILKGDLIAEEVAVN